MRHGPALMLRILEASVMNGASQGHAECGVGKIDWRLKSRRVEGKDRENVLSIANITLKTSLCGRGYMSEIIQHILAAQCLAGRPVDWIYFEQCRFRLANHLQATLGFSAEFGVVIDAWRRTGDQLEMAL